jgi:hypothetical protein
LVSQKARAEALVLTEVRLAHGVVVTNKSLVSTC